ncbi:hypothetical protein SUGI_0173570 [Cryptomeria japonica]|nr:hypothetical protein SUGI_0173570 [Cryptomeria japonica]
MPPNEHGKGIDMCSINPNFMGKMYCYVYSCRAQHPCNFLNALTKIDLKEKKAKDDGVVLSLVSDSNGDGFILVLDGTTFTEIAQTKLPYGLPYGLHGCWIPTK